VKREKRREMGKNGEWREKQINIDYRFMRGFYRFLSEIIGFHRSIFTSILTFYDDIW